MTDQMNLKIQTLISDRTYSLVHHQSGGGEDDESKFPNSRYYIKRLENADLKLFKYDSKSQKDKYAKKCQSSNNTQPLALTREEYDNINK